MLQSRRVMLHAVPRGDRGVQRWSFITFSAGLSSEDSALGSGGWKLCGLTPFAILHRSGGTTGRRGSLVAEGRHRFATRHRCSLARLFCAAFTLFLSQNAHESFNESVRELVCVCSLACAPIVFVKVLTLCMLESFQLVHLSACAPHLDAKFESGSIGFPCRWLFASFHFRVDFCSPPPRFLQVRSSCL